MAEMFSVIRGLDIAVGICGRHFLALETRDIPVRVANMSEKENVFTGSVFDTPDGKN